MTGDSPRIPFPTAEEKETKYLGKSGAIVTLRLIDTDYFEVKLDVRGDYTATLRRHGPDDFELVPAPGVAAVGGTGITEAELWERF